MEVRGVNFPLRPYILDAYDAVNEYIREQRVLLAANNYDNQYNLNIDEAIDRYTEIATIRIELEHAYLVNPEQQNSLPDSNHPTPPLRVLRKEVDQFMYSLNQIDIGTLAEDNKLCEICFLCFDEWRWDDKRPADAGALKPFEVLNDMMPENPVRLPCGHIFGELCLRTWIMKMDEGPPTCPKCRRGFKSL